MTHDERACGHEADGTRANGNVGRPAKTAGQEGAQASAREPGQAPGHEAPRYVEDECQPADRFFVSVGRALINGGQFPYSFVRVKPGVCILPVVGEGPGAQTVLIRQYRFPVGAWQTELPAGAIDPGEEPAVAAARELAEESGYTARELVDLGPFHPSPGATDETIYLFLARCDAREGSLHLDPAEDIRHRRVPMAELARLVGSGEFCHGAGIAAWARATARGLI